MNVVFRADASLQIGTGHVMRCLTLARGLADRGHQCQFITRLHPGNLVDYIGQSGFPVHVLNAPGNTLRQDPEYEYARWLGVSQNEDATECKPIVDRIQPDWVVVDHYGLGVDWQTVLAGFGRTMVIDDLANRQHDCDLLLDQTFGRSEHDYRNLVSPETRLLCGAEYAMLRKEFSELRPYSLDRRKSGDLDHLLVTMGGVDKDNATEQVLNALRDSGLPEHCKLTVVMGNHAPWLASVQNAADKLPWSTEVRVGVRDMAALIAECDAAIGAAGATSWERCCLGLPTIMVVVAENQRDVALGLSRAGAAFVIGSLEKVSEDLPVAVNRLASSREYCSAMGTRAASIVDGFGVDRVVAEMERGCRV
jgi:UDP-2,4-diacetamido-2,4,6-trideoxy-beta-L-altropyranose hydrolase